MAHAQPGAGQADGPAKRAIGCDAHGSPHRAGCDRRHELVGAESGGACGAVSERPCGDCATRGNKVRHAHHSNRPTRSPMLTSPTFTRSAFPSADSHSSTHPLIHPPTPTHSPTHTHSRIHLTHACVCVHQCVAHPPTCWVCVCVQIRAVDFTICSDTPNIVGRVVTC